MGDYGRKALPTVPVTKPVIPKIQFAPLGASSVEGSTGKATLPTSPASAATTVVAEEVSGQFAACTLLLNNFRMDTAILADSELQFHLTDDDAKAQYTGYYKSLLEEPSSTNSPHCHLRWRRMLQVPADGSPKSSACAASSSTRSQNWRHSADGKWHRKPLRVRNRAKRNTLSPPPERPHANLVSC